MVKCQKPPFAVSLLRNKRQFLSMLKNHNLVQWFLTRKKLFLISLFIILLILDQLTKYFARKLAYSMPIIKNFFHLTFVKNTGIGFGLFQNANPYLIWISIIALGFIMYYYDKMPKKTFPKVAVLFIAAGIAGNLIDRLVFGHVIDFIDFRIWPVFNIADSLITIGIITLIFYSLKKP
jgi:signal peptidase II